MERDWKFGSHGDHYEELLLALENSCARIEKLLKGFTDDQLEIRHENKWSVKENIGHLLTIESLWIARLDDFVMKNPSLRPWNGTNADTDAGEFNRQRAAKILEDFADIRSTHTRMLRHLNEKRNELECFHDKFNQKLSLADHVYIMSEHDETHIQRITEILQAI
jgi:uncharacterized damage-inducible protein DinB